MTFEDSKGNITHILASNHGILAKLNDYITVDYISPYNDIFLCETENKKLRKASLNLIREIAKRLNFKELQDMYFYRLEQQGNIQARIKKLEESTKRYEDGLDNHAKIKTMHYPQTNKHPFIKRKINHANNLYNKLNSYSDYLDDCINQIESYYLKSHTK